MAYGYEYEILLGIILTVIIILMIMALIIEKFFPKNKISKALENIAEWIKDNIRI
ncbi:MAG: hypothetical protein Q7R52_00865 [archaeon]|nr:hypothetical protein [archaeon]